MSKSSLFLVAIGGVVVGALSANLLSSSPSSSPDADQTGDDAVSHLQIGERHHGEITSASELNGNDGSRFLRHRLTLSEGDLVELSLRGALLGRLALYDEREQLVGIAGDGTTLRRRVADDGDYLLVVSGIDAHSYGPFDLVTRTLDLSLSESGTALEGESELSGWLQDEDNQHTLVIEEAGLYQIDLSSDDFDAYLVLKGQGDFLREDDDSAGNLDARISAFLDPGEYQITARRSYYAEGAEGLYHLEVSSKALSHDLQNGGELPLGESIHGWYDASINYESQPLRYQLTLEEDAILTLEMLSADFDTYLELEGEGLHLRDDDGGDGTNSRLRHRLPAGDYTVTARSFSSYDSAGVFELRTSVTAPSGQTNDGRLAIDEPLEAWLEPDARDEYVFRIEEAGDYRLDMVSDELDAYLELEGEGVSLSDDDGGDGFDARIQTRLEPGEYRATARSFNSYDSGYYVLTLTEE